MRNIQEKTVTTKILLSLRYYGCQFLKSHQLVVIKMGLYI